MANKTTGFTEFILSMKIPEVTENACRVLDHSFKGSLEGFLSVAQMKYDFSLLDGIDKKTSISIHNWVHTPSSIKKWETEYARIFEPSNGSAGTREVRPSTMLDDFRGKAIVVTGSVPGYTRGEVTALVAKKGGTVMNKVTGSTDYLVVENTSRETVKLREARRLRITMVEAGEFSKWLSRK